MNLPRPAARRQPWAWIRHWPGCPDQLFFIQDIDPRLTEHWLEGQDYTLLYPYDSGMAQSVNPEVWSLLQECTAVITALLKRDQQNTCRHQETHRQGAIWEVCNDCNASWADDRGGKPEWHDPEVWTAAEALLDLLAAVDDAVIQHSPAADNRQVLEALRLAREYGRFSPAVAKKIQDAITRLAGFEFPKKK